MLLMLLNGRVIDTGLGEVNVWGVSGFGTGIDVESNAESE